MPTAAPDTTRNVGELYEETDSGLVSDHIYLGGQRVATVRNGQVFYYLVDHLGGTNIVSDAKGALKEYTRHDPYGRVQMHTGTSAGGRYFTGQEYDGEVGLYYYNARHYDPALGRFMQADSVVPDLLYPRSFNRHSYTLNNPVNGIDPSGHETEEVDLGRIEVSADKSPADGPGGGNSGAGDSGPAGSTAGSDMGDAFSRAGFGGRFDGGGSSSLGGMTGAAGQAVSMGMDFTPGISTAKGLSEVVSGSDMITGERIHRGIAAVGLVASLVDMKGAQKLLGWAGREVKLLAGGRERIGYHATSSAGAKSIDNNRIKRLIGGRCSQCLDFNRVKYVHIGYYIVP